jgi:hypothetical protein
MTPHNIHAGKNEPRRLKEGAREHPAISNVAAEEAAATATPMMRRRIGEFNSLVTLRPFCMMKQVSRLEG